MTTKEILEELSKNNITVEEALLQIKTEPFVDLEYAKVDVHRKVRQGVSEVIYGAGKTAEQIVGITQALIEHGGVEDNSGITDVGAKNHVGVLPTRVDKEKAEAVRIGLENIGLITKNSGDSNGYLDFTYNEMARCIYVGSFPKPNTDGSIVIVTGGTSDMPVAEEAAFTAEALGNKVTRIYDAGVAGIHRLLSHQEDIMTASVIIAIAGMEGALASVVGGMADCPVIAVPTSVGYGAAFEGLSALLSMLNSCASGVSVVNIDNGFGAAYQASLINHK